MEKCSRMTPENAKYIFEELRQHSITTQNCQEYCDAYFRFVYLPRHTKDSVAVATSFYYQKLKPMVTDRAKVYELDITVLELKTEQFLPTTQFSFEHVSEMQGLTVDYVKRLAICFSRYQHIVPALQNAVIACRMDQNAVRDVLGVFLEAGRLDLIQVDYLDEERRKLIENIASKELVLYFLYKHEQELAEKRQYSQYARALLLSDIVRGDAQALIRSRSVLIDCDFYDLSKGIHVDVDFEAVRRVGDADVHRRCE